MSLRLPRSFFQTPPDDCARALLGATFKHGACSGSIVETEAYAAVGDEACHTFFRQKARDFVERFPAGTGYVYLNYGVYWLANVLTKTAEGEIGFVLIRAIEPTEGIAWMRRRRGKEKLKDLCSGPGKLTIALGIDQRQHGTDFTDGNGVHFLANHKDHDIVSGPRIGISKEAERPWRFGVAGSQFLSKPFA